jgi:FkbM family methyltransferase
VITQRPAVGLAKSIIKVARARVFEAFGSRRFNRPALYGLDDKLAPYLTSSGVFLEIGANDGYSQSNTYRLERDLGWSGILIEPLPRLFRLCSAHRRRSHCFNVACVGPGGPESLEIEDRGLVTHTVEALESQEAREGRDSLVRVPTATMSSVIHAAGHPRIDFMSIDVEGAELHVLAGLDLEVHCPAVLLVETKDPGAIDRVLAGSMYRAAQLTHHDFLYLRGTALA